MIDWLCSKSFVRDNWLQGSVPTNFDQDCRSTDDLRLSEKRDSRRVCLDFRISIFSVTRPFRRTWTLLKSIPTSQLLEGPPRSRPLIRHSCTCTLWFAPRLSQTFAAVPSLNPLTSHTAVFGAGTKHSGNLSFIIYLFYQIYLAC